jgi:outer membrane autotransporter protein
MHRSQVLRPQDFLFDATNPYPTARKTRRAALFLATALTGSFVLAPTLTTPVLAAGSTNVTTTAGDTSAGSIRGAAQDPSDYQFFVFQNLGSAATINLGGPLTFTHTFAVALQFSGTTTSVTIGGDTISAANHLYFYLNNSSNDLTLNSDLNFTGIGKIALVQGGTVTFNGDISDVGILQARSNGTAVIGTTTAPTEFEISSGGTLRFATAGTYSSNLEIRDTATIDTGTFNVTISGPVTNSGGSNTLVKTGSGTLTLSGTNTASGTMRIDAGTLSVASDGNLSAGTLTFNGGNLAITGATTIDNAMALAANATITNSADVILSGVISGTGNLTKAGASTLTLSGTNIYSGGTTISGGTLQIGNGGTTGSVSGDIVNNGALAFNRSDAVTFNGDISGTGSLIKSGAGTLTLTSANSYTGGTTISAGTLQIGNGGTSGSLTGDIVNDSALVFNRSDASSYGGNLSGTGTLTKSGAGTLTMTGANSHTGGTTISAGTLQIGDGGTSGSLTGDITNNAALAFNRSDAMTFNGDISGTGSLTKSGAGTLTLTGANSHTGGTTVSGGTLQIGDGGTSGSVSGDVVNNAALAFNRSDAVTFSGDISGTGSLTKSGAGTLTLTGTNTYSGTTTISGGTLQIGDSGTTGSLTGDIVNNAALAFNRSDAVIFNGDISGTGSMTKSGSGTLTLTGTNSYTGGTTVAGGLLTVNGSTGDILLNGGTLGGSGTVGSVTANSGASVAPGNSIGTLNVSGNVTFSSGSTYAVEVDSAGMSDKIAATGTAAIDSGATVTVSAENGTDNGSTYAASTTYTILTASGGVTGTFGSVSENFAYLDAALGYDANTVSLKLTRNATGLASAAETANQRAAANAVSSLSAGNAVYDAVIVLNEEDARSAFDSLSGEVHASTNTLLIQESSRSRDAVGARIRGAFDGLAAAEMPMIALHGAGEAPDGTGGAAAWGQAYGGWGKTGGNRNAATMDHTSGGFFVGADMEISSGWRAGLVAGYGNSRFDVDARASSGDADSYTLGAYAGRRFDALGLRIGTTYTWNDVSTSRNVVAGTLSNSLSADYTASTAQVFSEVGYTFNTPLAHLESFAGAALIHQHVDGFSETGGAAALTVSSSSQTLGLATLGLRAERHFAEVTGLDASLTGALAWRHAFGDIDAASTMRFATGNAFAISGTPLDRDTALIETGFKLGLGDGTNVSLTYRGDIGATSQDHGFNARFSARF